MVEVAPEATHDLRRRVLRDGRAEAEVRFAGDDDARALHLAVVHDGAPLAIATALPLDCPRRPAQRAWKVRGMAVEPDRQGEGFGGWLLDDIVRRASEAGVEVVWADGRDSALDFYRRRGWSVEGEGYVTPDTGLAHHRVILDLAPSAPP